MGTKKKIKRAYIKYVGGWELEGGGVLESFMNFSKKISQPRKP